MKTYEFGRYASIEVDNGKFTVYNEVQGLPEKVHTSWPAAKEHAMMIMRKYQIVAKQAGWDGYR